MPSKNERRVMQRCGRYKYQKLLVDTTNPDHVAASKPSLTDIPQRATGSRCQSWT
jgi:hypothetical protein